MTASHLLTIRGHILLPIVQGGMGVGVSAHRLAGAVARAGAMGTIASIDLRHHHADLVAQAKHCRDKDELNRLNLIALDREIKAALGIAAGKGLVAVIVLKKWARRKRLPDAIVIEHPRYAGGHLGAPNPDDLSNSRFDFSEVLPGVFKVFDDLGIARGQIPVIVGGGINSHEKLLDALALRASGVQLGTPFAVTGEGDAHPN